jgi:hypothetical protein
MPLLHHAMAGPLRRDGETVELARETDREVADVDHLLHFAEAFLQNLAGFERDEAAQRILVGAQFLAEQAHEFAAPGRGHIAPRAERFDACRDLFLDGRRRVERDAPDFRAVDRRADDMVAGWRDAELGENVSFII